MIRLTLFLLIAALMGCGKVTADEPVEGLHYIDGMSVLEAGGHKNKDGKIEPAIIMVDNKGRVFCNK